MRSKIKQTLGVVAALVIASGCETLKKQPHDQELDYQMIKGMSCKDSSLEVAGESRGALRVDVFKDYLSGNAIALGKMVLLEKSASVNPYLLLGYKSRSKEDRKAIKNIKTMSVGPLVTVNFGTEEPAAEADAPSTSSIQTVSKEGGEKKSAILRTQRKSLGALRANTESSSAIALNLQLAHSNTYLSNYKEPLSLGSLSVMEENDLSVNAIRSLLVDVGSKGLLVAAFPGSPDYDYDAPTYSAEIGKDKALAISISPDENTLPAQAQSKVLIEITHASQKPEWIRICEADDANEINVPTESIPDGDAFVSVMRTWSKMYNVPDKDAGAILVDASSGFRTKASFKTPEPTTNP